jgi:hypothetical protein
MRLTFAFFALFLSAAYVDQPASITGGVPGSQGSKKI